MNFDKIPVIEKTVHTTGIPLLIVSMIVVTSIAGFPGCVVLSRALGPERAHEAIRTYAWIALWTAFAEGLTLAAGIYIFHRLSNRIKVLNDELKNLTRNVLHDLRTPIAQIHGEAELVLHDMTDAKSAAANIADACGTILRIVNANIEISRNYAGTDSVPAEKLDFAEIIRETCDLFSAVAEMKGIVLKTELPDTPMNFLGHRHKIQQLAGNLLDNALKFTPQGGTVTLSLGGNTRAIRMTVSDTGVGIDSKDLPSIYERFFRTDRSRNTPGSGLGLSLVHAVVSFYRGSINCSSKTGEGTTFTVRLPAASAGRSRHRRTN